MKFDRVITVDWSGGNDRGSRPVRDAIWTCIGRGGKSEAPIYHRNRTVAEAYLFDTLASGESTLLAIDLCFAYPDGFAKRLTGSDDPLDVWDWFEARIEDAPDANNRFDIAGQINAMFDGIGPFWGNGLKRDIDHLPRKGLARTNTDFAEKRAADLAAKGAFSPWQLAGAGSVGGQVMMGLPMLSRLRKRQGVSVWPFQAASHITLAETYFSLLPDALSARGGTIKDADQVALFAQVFSGLSANEMAQCLDVKPTSEGWVFGVGQEELLRKKANAAPPLRNDCFAMPQGAHWTSVDDALAHLQSHLNAVQRVETLDLSQAAGRFLAKDVTAKRSHPPAANSAVDGYALRGPVADGLHRLPLADGRSAAGDAFDRVVPDGHALRILTGANMPDGTDTVILQEDVAITDGHVSFHGPLRRGANARKAGEDMKSGQVILTAGRRITPADVAMMTAAGVGPVSTHHRLRVGVLSTGDELIDAGQPASDAQIFDANRPMLLADVAAWGYLAMDLGQAPDDRDALRGILDDAAGLCDVIITSGGASAGDEDHMSALLQGTGSLALWRIAMKPGRPLAMGLWGGVPVLGLPGNPVAAQVCALVFAAPALRLLAGGDWVAPQGFKVPAAFTKSKKAGRREYLRARLVDGRAETFGSEGSGRVSGLSWATGLVVLGDDAATIAKGDLVTFIPFESFGI